MLKNQHGVAIRKEAEALFDGDLVRFHGELIARERRDEHQERRTGEVKVGQEVLGILERIARIDEEIRLESPRSDQAILGSHRLESAAAGRPYQDLLFAGRTAVEAAHSPLADMALLEVHGVAPDILRLHRAESPDPHMQRHLGLRYPPIVKL